MIEKDQSSEGRKGRDHKITGTRNQSMPLRGKKDVKAGRLKICAQVWDSLIRGRQNANCLPLCKSVGYFVDRDLGNSSLWSKNICLLSNDFQGINDFFFVTSA